MLALDLNGLRGFASEQSESGAKGALYLVPTGLHRKKLCKQTHRTKNALKHGRCRTLGNVIKTNMTTSGINLCDTSTATEWRSWIAREMRTKNTTNYTRKFTLNADGLSVSTLFARLPSPLVPSANWIIHGKLLFQSPVPSAYFCEWIARSRIVYMLG